MKIIGNISIEISEAERTRIARDAVYDALKKGAYDWSHNYFINDGKVFSMDTYTSSHSWSTDTFKRDATETDYIIIKLLESL